MGQSKIVSIILNTDRRDDTLACVASLRANTYPNHAIVVLDNASRDGSVQALRSEFPEVQVIELPENHGYAGNNNVGIEYALAQGADWVFVLNEDTILAPDCIAQLVDIGESDPKIGIVGPMVYHHNEANIIQSAGGMFGQHWEGIHIAQNEQDIGQIAVPHSVDWISGCAIMVRRPVILQVGVLDARFFYYVEEFEWCFRARKAGWFVMHVPGAKVWHKGVQRDYHPKPSVTYYSTRNKLLMLAKHRAPFVIWANTWVRILRIMTSWTLKPKWRHMREHRNAMWRGVMDFFHRRWGQMTS